MSSPDAARQPATQRAVPIRDLGLTIAGTALEPIIAEFKTELDRAGIRRLQPRFYLSTEWGVPFDTIAIALPFYLARPDLTALQAERTGFVEGMGRADILRYVRHEMGHVVNYAYRLYDRPDWVQQFGAITQPYEEEYRPEPFSRRFVHHLPGWYAQKHPDEDWAETFAVWLTHGRDWRAEYADWPVALAKLKYCDATLAELRDREPLVTDVDLDEDVGDLQLSLEQYYGPALSGAADFPPGLDGALRAIFENLGPSQGASKPASELLQRLEGDWLNNVYRWTGHFPERTRLLLRHLQQRADHLGQTVATDREIAAIVALTTFITTLATNYVHRGTYMP
jgi:hypothetical protein